MLTVSVVVGLKVRRKEIVSVKGSPIKGLVKRKNTSPMKKTPLVFRLALSSPQHGVVFTPVSHPLFRSCWFAVQSMLIRTSHPSGSRRLCCKRNAYNTAPGPFGPQKIFSAMPRSIVFITNLMVVSQPRLDSRHRRIRI